VPFQLPHHPLTLTCSHCAEHAVFHDASTRHPTTIHRHLTGAGFWWGENLVGTMVAPVTLSDQTKLVYSPHVYGPSVYEQNYFMVPEFPRNMPGVWEGHFAFAQERTGRPIVLGATTSCLADQFFS
jgi:aryl-phospho-beta-D-glucosidase BglC (GH1 family)